jgi:hypothetical protein
MNIKYFYHFLKKMVFNFVERDGVPSKIIFLENNGSLTHYINILITDRTPYNPEIYNGTFENLVIKKVQDFLEGTLQNDRKKLELNFNLDEEYSCLILMYAKQINKDNILDFTRDEEKQQIIEKKKKEKNIKDVKTFLAANPSGVSLAEITRACRRINKEEKKEILDNLVNVGFCILTKDRTLGRVKRIYKKVV